MSGRWFCSENFSNRRKNREKKSAALHLYGIVWLHEVSRLFEVRQQQSSSANDF
jgi:hypothetical protein